MGLGYGGPAVVAGRVYLMDYVRTYGKVENKPDGRQLLDGTERVLCLDSKTGKEIWKHEFDRPYNLSYPGGPRTTPTVADGKVYLGNRRGEFFVFAAQAEKNLLHSVDFGAPISATVTVKNQTVFVATMFDLYAFWAGEPQLKL